MKTNFYVSIFVFVFTILLFPTMYNEARSANITNPSLAGLISNLPIIILLIVGILPLYTFIEGREEK